MRATVAQQLTATQAGGTTASIIYQCHIPPPGATDPRTDLTLAGGRSRRETPARVTKIAYTASLYFAFAYTSAITVSHTLLELSRYALMDLG